MSPQEDMCFIFPENDTDPLTYVVFDTERSFKNRDNLYGILTLRMQQICQAGNVDVFLKVCNFRPSIFVHVMEKKEYVVGILRKLEEYLNVSLHDKFGKQSALHPLLMSNGVYVTKAEFLQCQENNENCCILEVFFQRIEDVTYIKQSFAVFFRYKSGKPNGVKVSFPTPGIPMCLKLQEQNTGWKSYEMTKNEVVYQFREKYACWYNTMVTLNFKDAKITIDKNKKTVVYISIDQLAFSYRTQTIQVYYGSRL